MIKKNFLKTLKENKEPFIIYKTKKGFDLYTNFSKKIILTNENIKKFIDKITKYKKKKSNTDLFIGFFGYEVLNNLINVKLPKQKSFKFPKGIFYKPEKYLRPARKFWKAGCCCFATAASFAVVGVGKRFNLSK